MSLDGDQSAAARDFAQIWRAAHEIVLPRTLDTSSSARIQLELLDQHRFRSRVVHLRYGVGV